MRVLIAIVLIFTSWSGSAQVSLGEVKEDKQFDCGAYKLLNPLHAMDFIDSLYGIPKICNSKNQIEIRFRREYPPTSKVDLIITTYSAGEWNAIKYEMYLDTITYDKEWNASHNKIVITKVLPGSISHDLADRLRESELFSLPDQKDLKVKSLGKCGTPYFITFKVDNAFRSYSFQDPQLYADEYPNSKYFTAYRKIVDLFVDGLNEIKGRDEREGKL